MALTDMTPDASLVREPEGAWSMRDLELARYLGFVQFKLIRPAIMRAIGSGLIVPRSRRPHDEAIPTAWVDLGTVKGKKKPTAYRLNRTAAVFMCGRVPATKAASVIALINDAFNRADAPAEVQEQPMAKKTPSNVLTLPIVNPPLTEESSGEALADYEEVRVTPEVAARYLDKNHHNQRPVNTTLVARYVAEMRAGRWSFTGAPIEISVDGLIIDGQHRLTAVRLSGVAQTFLVVRHRGQVNASVIDSGRSRTAGDSLVMVGATERGTGKAAAACASALKKGADCIGAQIAHSGILTVYRLHKEGIDFSISNLPSAIAPIRAAVAYLYPALPTQVAAFTEKLRTHVGIQPDSGEQALSLLMQSKGIKTMHELQALFYRTMYALQASCEGRKIKILKRPVTDERPTCLAWADRKREAARLHTGSGYKRDE